MKKELVIIVTLLFLSFGLAYRASLPVSESDESKEWFSVDPKGVTAITYKLPLKSIHATQQPDGQGYWVDWSETTEIRKPAALPPPAAHPVDPTAAASTSPSPTPTPAEPVETKTEAMGFKANEQISTILDALKPFRAVRVVGKADKLDVKEYGLDDKAGLLTIATSKGESFNLRVGKRSYGSRNVFALDEKQGQVILIEATVIESLENAKTQLYERRIVAKELAEFKQVKAVAGGQEKALVQGDKDQNGEATWKDADEGATAKPNYKTWLDNVAKMRVQRFATKEEEAKIAGLPPFLELVLVDGDKEHDRLAFRKVEVGGLPDEKELSFWVSSKFLGINAKVPAGRMTTFETDVQGIVGTRK